MWTDGSKVTENGVKHCNLVCIIIQTELFKGNLITKGKESDISGEVAPEAPEGVMERVGWGEIFLWKVYCPLCSVLLFPFDNIFLAQRSSG